MQSFSTQPLHLTHFIRVLFSESLNIRICNIQSQITDRVCSKARVMELSVCDLSVQIHDTSNLKIVIASSSNLNFPFTSSLFDPSGARRS